MTSWILPSRESLPRGFHPVCCHSAKQTLLCNRSWDLSCPEKLSHSGCGDEEGGSRAEAHLPGKQWIWHMDGRQIQSKALHWLLEQNSLCLATACVLKSLRTSEVGPRASEGRVEIWEGKQIWFKEPLPCCLSASLRKDLATEHRSDLGMGNKAQPTWRVSPLSELTSAWWCPALPGARLGLASCWWPSCPSSPTGSACCHWWQSLHCLFKASLVL